jgi:hypothetical protein
MHGQGHRGHRGRGYRGSWQQADLPPADDVAAWFAGRLPDDWFAGEPTISDTTVLFTHLAVPAMTRLRHDERRVLDTLVEAGVARSRSDALAWCVRLVGEHTDEWLTGLRQAMEEVGKLRAEGPNLSKE